MSKHKEKKKLQLGIDPGTASNKLRKEIMFSLIKKLELNVCYQCGEVIENSDSLSIEHKTPWLDSEDPVGLFFDLNNIAYSHLSCNCKAGRKPNKKYFTEEEKREAKNRLCRESNARHYSRTKRQERYLRTGY